MYTIPVQRQAHHIPPCSERHGDSRWVTGQANASHPVQWSPSKPQRVIFLLTTFPTTLHPEDIGGHTVHRAQYQPQATMTTRTTTLQPTSMQYPPRTCSLSTLLLLNHRMHMKGHAMQPHVAPSSIPLEPRGTQALSHHSAHKDVHGQRAVAAQMIIANIGDSCSMHKV